jgi:hypothetical protein
MKYLQNLNKWLAKDSIFVISSFLVLITCSLFFIPKIASVVVPFQSQNKLQNFIKETTSGSFSTRAFWEFREFYSPGSFSIDRTGMKITTSIPGITFSSEHILPVIHFNSKKITSTEYLVDPSYRLDTIHLSKGKLIYENQSLKVYQDNKTYFLVFIATNMELQNTV